MMHRTVIAMILVAIAASVSAATPVGEAPGASLDIQREQAKQALCAGWGKMALATWEEARERKPAALAHIYLGYMDATKDRLIRDIYLHPEDYDARGARRHGVALCLANIDAAAIGAPAMH